jgi:hypothetical protein
VNALSRWLLQQVNASLGDHLFMGHHRAQYTRSGWALLRTGNFVEIALGPVRRGKVSPQPRGIQGQRAGTNAAHSPDTKIKQDNFVDKITFNFIINYFISLMSNFLSWRYPILSILSERIISLGRKAK